MQTIHITANSRLTANIKQQAVLQSKQNVVQTPKVMTLPQWWKVWQSDAMLTGNLPLAILPKKVLHAFEAQWLFEKSLNAILKHRQESQEDDGYATFESETLSLLNIPATAKLMYQAWVLIAEWIPDWQNENLLQDNYANAETSLFTQVLEHYLEGLKKKNWQDDALFSNTLLQALEQADKKLLPQAFELHGFDDISPNIKRWKRIVEQHGCVVDMDIDCSETEPQSFVLKHQGVTLYPARDSYDEVQQISRWALSELERLIKNKPISEIKIALVAPDVAEYKNLLTQALDEQLFLNGLGALVSQTANNSKLYNTSLGESLLAVPLIENAWQILGLFLLPNKNIAYQVWSEWLISPYTSGGMTAKHQADAEFRRLQWANVRWQKLLETDAAKYLPKSLLKNIKAWQTRFEARSQLQVSLNDFIETVWQLLSQIGWPGNRTLTSTEFQQKTAFENALTAFSGLTELNEKQNYQSWLQLLKRYLSEQIHQPQSVGAQPIQVMGMLEAGGQQFDSLWVLGLTNEAWPRMPSPNPFIPMKLQRSKGLPRSDAGRELIYAQQLSQRLVNSADKVHWSYPKQNGEAMLLSTSIFPKSNSEMVDQYKAIEYQSLPSLILALAQQNKDSKRLLWQEDKQGIPLPEGSVAPGGTGILQAQSQCPLMAYIDYRLGAKYGFKQVEDSLQNTNQGTLIHLVLEYFWQELQTQVAMLALSPEQRKQSLKTHIDSAFDDVQTGLSEGIQKVEKSRILELCLQWLELEEKRASFKVVETEKEHELDLAGIKFKIKIDRIDMVGSEAVILDYKTGKASIENLLKTPLAAPQLAAYLYAAEQVSGIGYALLHSDDGVKISAVIEEEDILYKDRKLKVFSAMAQKDGDDYFETSWDDFLAHLKQQVLELAEQVQSGFAPMVFDKQSDIQYAEGYLALRVPEVMQQLEQNGSAMHESSNEGAEK